VQVDLVGHSAGGWLARAYLADEKYHGAQLPAPAVSTLVTLGAPHLAPPKGVPGVFDATRGALDWLNDTYPGAHFASVKVRFFCVRLTRFSAGGQCRRGTSSIRVLTGKPARSAGD